MRLPSTVVLTLTDAVFRQMLAHAYDGLPDEACGMFAGGYGSDRVEVFYPMTNSAHSQKVYVLDGHEQLSVERAADEAGLSILGVMHSHTHTTAYPSPTDVADAAAADPLGVYFFVIVSLKHPEPALRAYKMLDGAITEHLVEVV
ncbi:MAG: M67 family metallopeptidase [Acidimicrobiia bacterium]|nr:M67 family metallopeptidase [Acidimicrobiia bacterium]